MDESLEAQLAQVKGSPEAKERFRVMIQLLSEELSVPEACLRLGVTPDELVELRDRRLQGILNAIEEFDDTNPP